MNEKQKLVEQIVSLVAVGFSMFAVPYIVFHGLQALIPGSEWYEVPLSLVVALLSFCVGGMFCYPFLKDDR